MFVNLTVTPSKPARPGLGGACCSSCAEHGGSCGSKGMGHGVQEYLPVRWQNELAAFSLGGPIPPPSPGIQGLTDPTTWGLGTWAMIGGGALLLMFAGKKMNRRRRSRAAYRRVVGH
jgi:hypothetical protein